MVAKKHKSCWILNFVWIVLLVHANPPDAMSPDVLVVHADNQMLNFGASLAVPVEGVPAEMNSCEIAIHYCIPAELHQMNGLEVVSQLE